jgi:hypothetical protein
LNIFFGVFGKAATQEQGMNLLNASGIHFSRMQDEKNAYLGLSNG